jgi:hypothetical protein
MSSWSERFFCWLERGRYHVELSDFHADYLVWFRFRHSAERYYAQAVKERSYPWVTLFDEWQQRPIREWSVGNAEITRSW